MKHFSEAKAKWKAAFFVLASIGEPILACTCVSYEPVRARERYHDSPVVFRGRVIDHNDDGSSKYAQYTLYRFEVVEAFKGIPTDRKEIFVDPGSQSSCYTTFESGKDTLFFLSNPRDQARVRGYFAPGPAETPGKPFPAAWKGREAEPVYSTNICGPVKQVGPDDPDLAWLRSPAKDDPRALGCVEGRVAQNLSGHTLVADAAPVRDALVSVTARGAFRREVRADSEGFFRADGVPPGEVTFQVTSPVLGKAFTAFRTLPILVPPAGCAVINPFFQTTATISGQVVDAEGRPARYVRVELGRRLENGRVRIIPNTWAETDGAGMYMIREVPIGPILLAVNLNGAPKTRMPFDPVYAPGTQDLRSARVFDLRPDEALEGVNLRLPPPLPFGVLRVDVLWPDGSPATDGARAVADDARSARADFARASPSSNRINLQLALGRKYVVSADWLSRGAKFLVVESEPLAVEFTRDGQTVEIRLREPKPR